MNSLDLHTLTIDHPMNTPVNTTPLTYILYTHPNKPSYQHIIMRNGSTQQCFRNNFYAKNKEKKKG